VVTPRVEASPDRSDFAKLGETIALEQTKQFADDIRSQVAKKSRELAEMNERLGKAMMAGPAQWQAIKRLRRDTHEPSASCWLHADTFCLAI